MFERFTAKSKDAIAGAHQEAAALGCVEVRTEHVLLALVSLGRGVAYETLAVLGLTYDMARDLVESRAGRVSDEAALAVLGIDLAAIRSAVDHDFGEGALDRALSREGRSERLRLAPETKEVLELSLREALSLKHRYIGTEHLLLGLARHHRGIGGEVLRELAPDVDWRQAVLDQLAARG